MADNARKKKQDGKLMSQQPQEIRFQRHRAGNRGFSESSNDSTRHHSGRATRSAGLNGRLPAS